MGVNKTLLLTVSLSFLLSTHASIAPSLSPTQNTDSLFEQAISATQREFKLPDPDVVDFCKGTENQTLCAETIAPYFQGSFDPIKALETEVEATLIQTLKVADIIAKSLDDPNTNKNIRGALDICKSQYKSIVSTLKEAAELLNQQNVVDAYYKFSSVISDQSTCEDAFVESPGVTIPFPDDSLTVYQLGGNCLTIMDEIVNNRNNYFLV